MNRFFLLAYVSVLSVVGIAPSHAAEFDRFDIAFFSRKDEPEPTKSAPPPAQTENTNKFLDQTFNKPNESAPIKSAPPPAQTENTNKFLDQTFNKPNKSAPTESATPPAQTENTNKFLDQIFNEQNESAPTESATPTKMGNIKKFFDKIFNKQNESAPTESAQHSAKTGNTNKFLDRIFNNTNESESKPAELAPMPSVQVENESKAEQALPPPSTKADGANKNYAEDDGEFENLANILKLTVRDFAFLFYDKTPNIKKLAEFYDIQDEKLLANFEKEILKAREKNGFCTEGVQSVLVEDSKIRMSHGFDNTYGYAYFDWRVKCLGAGQYAPPTAPSNARVWIKYGDRRDWLTPARDSHYMPALEFIYRLFTDKNVDTALDMIDGNDYWSEYERQKNKAILQEKVAKVFKDSKDNFQCAVLDSINADGNRYGILKPFSDSPVEWDFVTGEISGCADQIEPGEETEGIIIPTYSFKLRVNATHVDAQVLKEDFVQPQKKENE